MVMAISPSFQIFSNYIKSTWEYISNNCKNNNNKSNNNNNNSNNNSNNNYNSMNSIIDMNSILNSNNSINIFLEDFQKEQELLESNKKLEYDVEEGEGEEDNLKNNLKKDYKLIEYLNGGEQEMIKINFYVYRVLSWLLKHDSYYVLNNDNSEIHQLINQSLISVKNILELHEIPITLLPIVILYADNFVKRCGINNKQLFNLLLSSSIIVVKFFGESVAVDYKVLGQYFNITSKDLCYMERLFLNGINFELYSNNDQVIEFLENVDFEKQSFINDGQIL